MGIAIDNNYRYQLKDIYKIHVYF